MKVLILYCDYFGYIPKERNLESVNFVEEGASFDNCLLAFIQVEEKDEENMVSSRAKKLVNHLKWAMRKNECKRVVLHSFAHLGNSKANITFTKELFNDAETRLIATDHFVAQTPFGHFLDLDIKAPGFSLARIFKEL